MNKIFTQLLEKRGLNDDFLNLKYENLSDPFLLPDMKPAVKRIEKALENNEKILIYGDYDVDGVTASTVMEDALKLSGAKAENLNIMLPNRFIDGYGMSERLVERAKKEKISLVITVDCGSRNHEIIRKLKQAGIDTIVTDHHETADTLPKDAIAVVNPKRKDFVSVNGLNQLAGVGVAFKVAEALRDIGKLPAGQEKWLLDLVLIGTICDSMVLTGENRILCSFGFKVLAKTRRKGLQELMKIARVKNLNSDAIGFQLGPRLNAAGRLETADLSLELLRTGSASRAATLAKELEELNKKRKSEQRLASKEIRTRGVGKEPVLVEVGNWHEGILGIIAGHLVEDYHRPAFVLSEVEDGILKGSGRSFGDFNLAEALKNVEGSIIGGGGHAAAAGVRLKKSELNKFCGQLNLYYKTLNLKDQAKYLKPIPDLTLSDFSGLDLELTEELKTLEPFGEGNKEPIFRLEHVEISAATKMGAEQNHLRLDLSDSLGQRLKLISFFAPEPWLSLAPGDSISPIISVLENEFNGVKSLEARILDIE